MNRQFLRHNAALWIFLRRFCSPAANIHAFNKHTALLAIDADNSAALALVIAGYNQHRLFFFSSIVRKSCRFL